MPSKKAKNTWTHFHDMHSGGGQKEKWGHIYIEAAEEEARSVFYSRFGHNPNRVSCTCCGNDYAVNPGTSLARLTGFERGCMCLEAPRNTTGKRKGFYKTVKDPWFTEHYYLEQGEEAEAEAHGYSVSTLRFYAHYVTLSDYLKDTNVHVIYAKDILENERHVDVPEEGFVWQ